MMDLWISISLLQPTHEQVWTYNSLLPQHYDEILYTAFGNLPSHCICRCKHSILQIPIHPLFVARPPQTLNRIGNGDLLHCPSTVPFGARMKGGTYHCKYLHYVTSASQQMQHPRNLCFNHIAYEVANSRLGENENHVQIMVNYAGQRLIEHPVKKGVNRSSACISAAYTAFWFLSQSPMICRSGS